jgi:hypothetical protein
METKTIKLELITLDCQVRESINKTAVADYAKRWMDGQQPPPVIIFFDSTHYHLADGYHRYHAALKNQYTEVLADLHEGSKKDALWYATGANSNHGVQWKNGDKRRAVELALREFPDKSQTLIAEHVGCCQKLVWKIKADLEVTTSRNLPTRTTGKDGKSYPAHVEHKTDAPMSSSDAGETVYVEGAGPVTIPANLEHVSYKLRNLKAEWREASREDKKAFIEWIRKECPTYLTKNNEDKGEKNGNRKRSTS